MSNVPMTRLLLVEKYSLSNSLQFFALCLSSTESLTFVLSYQRLSGVTQQAIFTLGNLLGPVVNTTIEGGLERFFRQPTGCGEQTMIKLAPNVYVLEYLMNTNQLSGANEESAYRFIQSGNSIQV